MDICTIKYTKGGADEHKAHVLTIVDPGDGRVVAHRVYTSIDSGEVLQLLLPELESYQLRAVRDRALIVHADCGTQFTSAEYNNLLALYPWLVLSNSPPGKPWHNSIVENLQRSLFRRATFWRGLQSKGKITRP
jgi:transposase InsO family protein